MISFNFSFRLTLFPFFLIGALRHSLQDRLSKGSSGRSRDEIYLKLRTSTGKPIIKLYVSASFYAGIMGLNPFVLFLNSTAPPLKLIDLPGLDQRIVDDKMVSRHMLSCPKFKFQIRVCFFVASYPSLSFDGGGYVYFYLFLRSMVVFEAFSL